MTQPEYGNEPTRIISTADEQAEIERRRAEERAARNRSLGVVDHSNEPAAYATPVPKPTTDKALPSLGLFLLRLVIAVIILSAALLGVMYLMPEWSQGTMPFRLLRLMVVVVAGIVAYFATLLLLGFRVKEFARRTV